MRASQVGITIVLTSLTLWGVMMLVTWLLKDVTIFSFFVGIAAGIVSAIIVLVMCIEVLWRGEGPLDQNPPPPYGPPPEGG